MIAWFKKSLAYGFWLQLKRNHIQEQRIELLERQLTLSERQVTLLKKMVAELESELKRSAS